MVNYSDEMTDQGSNHKVTQGHLLTSALVEEVTVKVYALLLRDLRIEQERCRWLTKKPFCRRD